MASSGNSPMDDDVHVDEFVLGGREEEEEEEEEETGRSYDSKKR